MTLEIVKCEKVGLYSFHLEMKLLFLQKVNNVRLFFFN